MLGQLFSIMDTFPLVVSAMRVCHMPNIKLYNEHFGSLSYNIPPFIVYIRILCTLGNNVILWVRNIIIILRV